MRLDLSVIYQEEGALFMDEKRPVPTGGFRYHFHPRILGTPAPVFPGFEVDFNDPVSDEDKPDAIWHRQRAREMIRQHPEIKSLAGNTPSTAVWCILLALTQLALAVILPGQPLWLLVLVAYVVGSLININLFSLAHECNHSLVFKGESANRWLFTFTSLPMFLSAHHAWWIEHHIHHNDLGAKKDFIKRRRSFFLLTKTHDFFGFSQGPVSRILSWLATPLFFPYALVMLVAQVFRSLLGLIVYVLGCLLRGKLIPNNTTLAILADEHLVSGYQRYRLKHWAVIYPFLSMTMTGLLFWFVGWEAVLYLLLSALFTTGFLHPLLMGLILSNSHFHGHQHYQPSSSYYGWLNWITFHFGLHTEHHDFCSIPWSRLPRLRQIAPEFYETLAPTPSYSLLALQFVFGSPKTFTEQFDDEVHRNLEMQKKAA